MAASREKLACSVYWHDDVLLHEPGVLYDSPLYEVSPPHPESADRLRNLRSVLARGPLASQLDWPVVAPASMEDLTLFHDPAYVQRMAAVESLGRPLAIDRWFSVTGATWRAAVAAAGCAVSGARDLMAGRSRRAVILTRPPGHHAMSAGAAGYCVFNNAGLAALAARAAGAERVAIVDWDAHHGNGAQGFFYGRADVLTISVHVHTGHMHGDIPHCAGLPGEMGADAGVGANINVDLPVGIGDTGYASVFDDIVIPALRAFAPDLIVCAAGQDAGVFETAARQCLTMAGFHGIGTRMGQCADEVADGRLMTVQEGGYSLGYAPLCLYATTAGMLGAALELEDPLAYLPPGTDGRHRAAVRAAKPALEGCRERFAAAPDDQPTK
jgi:acetoin utilization deacetylase AcuC-like enzyme